MYLAIETSCDETSLAILDNPTETWKKDSHFIPYVRSIRVLADVVSSQISTHAVYGGVIPEIGAREHASHIHELLGRVLSQSLITRGLYDTMYLANESFTEEQKQLLYELDGVCVTTEPGLASALRVGKVFARSLVYYIHKHTGRTVPIIHVNHLRGHVISCVYTYRSGSMLDEVQTDYTKSFFPHIHLLVSGGNSQIIYMTSWRDFSIIGQTLDDAAGECFDKCARMLGLPYPGGVYVSRIAQMYDENLTNLPISMMGRDGLNMSFSGLKTAVRYHVQRQCIPDFAFEKPLSQQEMDILLSGDDTIITTSPKLTYIRNMCISIQHVIIRQLIAKVTTALDRFPSHSVGLSGGVSANPLLRSHVHTLASERSIPLYMPDVALTGDNAVMIGLAGIVDTATATVSA